METAEKTTNERKRDSADAMELMLIEALDKRDKLEEERWKSRLAKLSEPDREPVSDVLDVIDEHARRTTRPHSDPDSEIRISRNQPTDPLYERLYARHPCLKAWRTPDLDHWNAQWMRAFVARNLTMQQLCMDKLGEVSGLGRAVTTYAEGALDSSDPTAILDGTAGSLLPQPFANVVIIARDEVAVLPALVLGLTMTSGTLRVPTASAFTVEMVAEGATSDEAGPTAASVMMKAQKMSGFAKITVEALADAAFNVMSLLGQRAGMAMGALEDVQICTSDGTAPNISAKIAGGNVDEATTTVLIYEDLVALYFALGKVYRTNSVWLANSVTLTLLSTLMDGNDHPILKFPTQQPNVVSDAPGAIGSLFNKPVFEVPLVDGTLMFGDPSGYGFARRQGLTVASSTESSFSADVVDLKFTERIDGQLLDAVALKQMADLATVA